MYQLKIPFVFILFNHQNSYLQQVLIIFEHQIIIQINTIL